VACRRVLSSAPLLVKVREPVETAGKRDLQTRTYYLELRNYNLQARTYKQGIQFQHSRLESVNQVVGPISNYTWRHSLI
jgi:hypothetical protein